MCVSEEAGFRVLGFRVLPPKRHEFSLMNASLSSFLFPFQISCFLGGCGCCLLLPFFFSFGRVCAACPFFAPSFLPSAAAPIINHHALFSLWPPLPFPCRRSHSIEPTAVPIPHNPQSTIHSLARPGSALCAFPESFVHPFSLCACAQSALAFSASSERKDAEKTAKRTVASTAPTVGAIQ